MKISEYFLLVIIMTAGASCGCDRRIQFGGAIIQEIRVWVQTNVDNDIGVINQNNIANKSVTWNVNNLKKSLERVAGEYNEEPKMRIILVDPPKKSIRENKCTIIVVSVELNRNSRDAKLYGAVDFDIKNGELLGAVAGQGKFLGIGK